MKNLIIKYKKWIIIFSFAYIYIVMMLLAPSGYEAITPGALGKVSRNYEIENVSFDNDISSISVYGFEKLTIFQKWLVENSDRYLVTEVSEYQKKLTTKELRKQGQISNISSHNNALITAYEYAGKIDKSIKISYELNGFTVYSTNLDKLLIGDLIVGFDGIEINTNSYEEYLTTLNLYNDSVPTQVKKADYKIKVLRNDEYYIFDVSSKNTINFYPKYTIIDSNPKITSLNRDKTVEGPSGGMIQTLEIYSALLKIDYKNFKIAGTGTIVTNAKSTVGLIGGLKQKYFTALEANVDILIVPNKQISEILPIKNANIIIIGVETFDDVIKKVSEVAKNA